MFVSEYLGLDDELDKMGHRLLRPEDPRPELSPAKNSVSVCPNGRALTFL